jgi:hypothetical protein
MRDVDAEFMRAELEYKREHHIDSHKSHARCSRCGRCVSYEEHGPFRTTNGFLEFRATGRCQSCQDIVTERARRDRGEK